MAIAIVVLVLFSLLCIYGIPVLLLTNLFVKSDAKTGIKIRKKRITAAFVCFVAVFVLISAAIPFGVNWLMSRDESVALPSINKNRIDKYRAIQIIDTFYPKYNAQCLWGAAATFTEDMMRSMFHKTTCNVTEHLCAESVQQAFEKKYDFLKSSEQDVTIISDLDTISATIELLAVASKETYKIARSINSYTKTMSETDARESRDKFYSEKEMPLIIEQWEMHKQHCQDVVLPVWATGLDKPMLMVRPAGIKFRE